MKIFSAISYFLAKKIVPSWDDFTHRIINCYPDCVPNRGVEGVIYHDAIKAGFDCDIVKDFWGSLDKAREKSFSLDQIADLIDRQPKGLEGALINNGCSNLFFLGTKDSVLLRACVRWSPDEAEWRFRLYGFGVYGEHLNNVRIFENT
jgi:hypothetical protein